MLKAVEVLEQVRVCVCLALTNLDYITLHGKQIKVTASKHSVVQLPKEGTVVGRLYWLYPSVAGWS